MFKKTIVLICVIALSASMLSACGSKKETDSSSSSVSSSSVADVDILNFEKPVDGEEIAIITFKNFGDVKIKLFPDQAPLGVQNFIEHSKNGYYDELIIHRVEKDFCIQGGDPKGNGTGGKSIWGDDFEIEASEKLRNFTGAVAYAHAQNGENGSQFYIISSKPGEQTDDKFKSYEQGGKGIPKNVQEKYKEVGGEPFLDGDYTVFGQVIEGMDVVQAINNVEVRNDGTQNSSKPVNQVLIEKIQIVKYKS